MLGHKLFTWYDAGLYNMIVVQCVSTSVCTGMKKDPALNLMFLWLIASYIQAFAYTL